MILLLDKALPAKALEVVCIHVGARYRLENHRVLPGACRNGMPGWNLLINIPKFFVLGSIALGLSIQSARVLLSVRLYVVVVAPCTELS